MAMRFSSAESAQRGLDGDDTGVCRVVVMAVLTCSAGGGDVAIGTLVVSIALAENVDADATPPLSRNGRVDAGANASNFLRFSSIADWNVSSSSAVSRSVAKCFEMNPLLFVVLVRPRREVACGAMKEEVTPLAEEEAMAERSATSCNGEAVILCWML